MSSPCGPCGQSGVPRLLEPEVAAPPGMPSPPGGGAEASGAAGVSGGPSSGPPGGTSTGGGSGTGTGGSTGGKGGGSSSGGSASASEAFAANFADSFITMIQNASSGEALEAQDIILRRIALEGDVVPSRVVAPTNVTEVGGYINLLGTLGEVDMRAQVLAGILGVAGPNPPLGWLATPPQLSFAALPNDRPEGALQPTLPLTVPVRSDFLPAVQAALARLHEQGCLVPLLAGPSVLPSAHANGAPPSDPMPYIGRVLTLAGAAACSEPATDALALARPQGTTGPFEIAAIARGLGAAGIAPANYEALVCTASACAPAALTGAALVFLAPVFAGAGFYPAAPLPQPTSSQDTRWTQLRNITGLVAGTTKLGDELALLYTSTAIAESVFAQATGWVWNGTAFAAAG
jgi:hypothetical protein